MAAQPQLDDLSLLWAPVRALFAEKDEPSPIGAAILGSTSTTRTSLRHSVGTEVAAEAAMGGSKAAAVPMDPVTIFAMIVIGLLLLCCCLIICYFLVWKRLVACCGRCTNCCMECKPRCRRCCQSCCWNCWYPSKQWCSDKVSRSNNTGSGMALKSQIE